MQKDTEQIILDTARKHFIQKGFSSTRMQEIADEAGINKAMLHYYFRTKDKLYRGIINQILRFVIPKFAGAISKEGTFWERVETIVDVYIDTLSENPDFPVFMMLELSQKQESFIEELQKHAGTFAAVHSFVQEMMMEMQAGKIKQMNPAHLLLNILGMTVFPFMAKPIYSTIFQTSEEDYRKMMQERKIVIVDFLKSALRVE